MVLCDFVCTEPQAKSQSFLRECFLSIDRVLEKNIYHREHRVFLKIFSVLFVFSVVKKPLRNGLLGVKKYGYSPFDGWASLFRENNASKKA
jgi:hypothetical protein